MTQDTNLSGVLTWAKKIICVGKIQGGVVSTKILDPRHNA